MNVESQPSSLGRGPETLLKQSPARSVRVIQALGGRRLVVKRFESPGLSLGRDRTRAQREFELLSSLHAAGAPVPRPLELRAAADSSGGAWEVLMEWFPEAVDLQAILDGEQPWPVPPRRLAGELARLVAGLQARGLDHPDLHAGNVLVRPNGALVAIDFHKARLVPQLTAGQLEGQLLQLAAGTREFVSRAFRARFLAAWREALPERLRQGLPQVRELVQRLEARARPLRREVVLQRQARWTRTGTAVVPLPRGSGWARVGSDPEWVAALDSGRADAVWGASRALISNQASSRALLDLWQIAARLFEHRLPCAVPLAIRIRPASWMALELPVDARPAEPLELARARARLEILLADRGLRARLDDEHVWVDSAGQPLAVAVPELFDA